MLLIWLPLALMCLMVYFLWRVVKLTPRVNTQRPASRTSSSVTWNDVAGLSEVKLELQEVVDFLRDPKRFEQLGARVPKGILFYGPAGHGEDAVGEGRGARVRLVVLLTERLRVRRDVCGPRCRPHPKALRRSAKARALDRLYRRARRGRRRANRNGFNREQDQTLNQLLVELDGFASDDRVVVMGASNRLQGPRPRAAPAGPL